MKRRYNGEVLFFGNNDMLWCTGIKETDERLQGYVENGAWYLDYNKHLNILHACDSKRDFEFDKTDEEWLGIDINVPRYRKPVNIIPNKQLTRRVKVHWKTGGPFNEYGAVIDRAREELVNPTSPEIDEPSIISIDHMLMSINQKTMITCSYDFAQYQCTTSSGTVYARDYKEIYDDAIPF